MQTLAFVNLKGGTAKTTSCLTMAAELALRGRRVLAVDLDPQASLTLNAGMEPAPAAKGFLEEELSIEEALEQAPQPEGLFLLRASRALGRLSRMKPAFVAARLQALSRAAQEAFDYVLVDAPPSASALSVGTLLAADATMAPVATGRGALEGLADTVGLIEQIGAAPLRAAFACRVDLRTTHDKETAAYIAERLEAGLSLFVRETVRVKEAEMAGVPLPVFDPNATATKDYQAILEELQL